MNLLYAKQDLETFSRHDITLLANSMNIHGDNHDDMLWLLAIKLHGKRSKAEMVPDLPKDMHIEIMKNMDMDTLQNMCISNKKLLTICQEPYFWKQWINGKNLDEQIKRASDNGLITVLYGLLIISDQNYRDTMLVNNIKSKKPNYKIIEVLLKSGANPNIHFLKDNHDVFPILVLIQNKHGAPLIKLLVEYGANVNELTDTGASALDFNVDSSYNDSWVYDNIKMLLSLGADAKYINQQYHSTLLMIVSDEKIAQLLLDYGAGETIPIQDNDGDTVLMYTDSIKIAKLLLDNGAKQIINVQNNNGKTALMKAITLRSADFIKLLLDNGADPNIHDNNGNTVLMEALYSYLYIDINTVLELLFQYNAKQTINVQNSHMNTALHIALSNDYEENTLYNVVKVLAEHGADSTIKNAHGDTAMSIIQSSRFKYIYGSKLIQSLLKLF